MTLRTGTAIILVVNLNFLNHEESWGGEINWLDLETNIGDQSYLGRIKTDQFFKSV